MTPEQYNATRGRMLSVAVMDLIREDHQAGTECTVWNLTRRIGEKHAMNTEERNQLRDRIRTIVDDFEGGGAITTKMGYNPKHQVNTKVITLCSKS